MHSSLFFTRCSSQLALLQKAVWVSTYRPASSFFSGLEAGMPKEKSLRLLSDRFARIAGYLSSTIGLYVGSSCAASASPQAASALPDVPSASVGVPSASLAPPTNTLGGAILPMLLREVTHLGREVPHLLRRAPHLLRLVPRLLPKLWHLLRQVPHLLPQLPRLLRQMRQPEHQVPYLKTHNIYLKSALVIARRPFLAKFSLS